MLLVRPAILLTRVFTLRASKSTQAGDVPVCAAMCHLSNECLNSALQCLVLPTFRVGVAMFCMAACACGSVHIVVVRMYSCRTFYHLLFFVHSRRARCSPACPCGTCKMCVSGTWVEPRLLSWLSWCPVHAKNT
jgi:hypothetical protein